MSNPVTPIRRKFPTSGKRADAPETAENTPPAAKPINRIAIRPNPSAATAGKPPAAKKPITPKEVTDDDLNKLVGGMEAGKKPPKKPTQPIQQEDIEEAEAEEDADPSDGDVWDDEEESEEVVEEAEEEVAEEDSEEEEEVEEETPPPPAEPPAEKKGRGRPPGTGKHQIAGRAPDSPKKDAAPAEKPRNYADPAQRLALAEKAAEAPTPEPATPPAVSADALEIIGQHIADLTEQVAQLKRQVKAAPSASPQSGDKAQLMASVTAFLNAVTAKILNS